MNLYENYEIYRNIIQGKMPEEELFLLKLQDNKIADFALKMIKNKKEYKSLLMLPEDFLNHAKIYHVEGLLNYDCCLDLDKNIEISNCIGLEDGIKFVLNSTDKSMLFDIKMTIYSAYFTDIYDVKRIQEKIDSRFNNKL